MFNHIFYKWFLINLNYCVAREKALFKSEFDIYFSQLFQLVTQVLELNKNFVQEF